MIQIILTLTLIALTSGSDPRPLVKPELRLCQTRGRDFFYNGHRYEFSWENEEASLYDWLDARNFCRRR